jgi:uncharacterized protein YndB with AHSA1/START domain
MTTDAGITDTNGGGRMSTQIEGLDFIASRVFDAPRELVFQAFSDCRHLVHWWGPTGWTLPVCDIDFRTGGTWRYCMRGPDGQPSCGKATYREIVEPERIVYTDEFTDQDGNVTPETPEMLVTVTFSEENGKTTLTNRARFASAKDLEFVIGIGMVDGLTETWDRLAAYLAAG